MIRRVDVLGKDTNKVFGFIFNLFHEMSIQQVQIARTEKPWTVKSATGNSNNLKKTDGKMMREHSLTSYFLKM